MIGYMIPEMPSQSCQKILKWLQISWKCTFAYTFVQKHLRKISWNQDISCRLASLWFLLMMNFMKDNKCLSSTTFY